MNSINLHDPNKKISRDILFKTGIDSKMLGIEIGQLDRPLISKKEGYRVFNIDVFTKDELTKKYSNDKNVNVEKMQDVDALWQGTLKSTVGTILEKKTRLSYIISSHNFEHIPNPLGFLKDCQDILEPGGILRMAIPTSGLTFDRFRPLSTTGEFIDANLLGLTKPSPGMLYDSMFKSTFPNKENPETFSLEHYQHRIFLEQFYNNWHDSYSDAHCWIFNPYSFQLIISDLQSLGFINLGVSEIVEKGEEFIVTLTNNFYKKVSRIALIEESFKYQAQTVKGF